MAAYFCQDFELATVAVATARGIVVHKDPAFAALGAHSMALPPTRGDYQRASVVIRTVVPTHTTVRDTTRRTIVHELLHVLGFGHTCSWPSVMTTGTLCADSLRAMLPSPEDVAHYFAMRWAREGERELETVTSISAAYAADLLSRGLTDPVFPYFGQP
jgi:hypothetical protein